MFETQPATPEKTPTLPAGSQLINGKPHMTDAKGRLVPEELVKPADKLEDQLVRAVQCYWVDLSAQIARFRGHCFEDIGVFDAALEEEYGAKSGGPKGNKTLMSYDGCMKVSVQVADLLDFGPSLQVAKNLVDECLSDWSEDARPEIRAIITNAFNVDKQGQINRTELFKLLRLDIQDKRWESAMQALRDAIRIIGSKQYIRFYQRETPQDKWQAVTIDMAKA